MHTVIVGATACGKSLLAKQFARDLVRRKRKVLVFDPMHSQDWPVKPYADIEDFYNAATQKKNKSAYLFIDEIGTLTPVQKRYVEQLASWGRHLGHYCFFISQRMIDQITPTIRAQTSILYVFRTPVKDAKYIAEEYTHDELLHANNLKQFEFYRYERFQEKPTKMRVKIK